MSLQGCAESIGLQCKRRTPTSPTPATYPTSYGRRYTPPPYLPYRVLIAPPDLPVVHSEPPKEDLAFAGWASWSVRKPNRPPSRLRKEENDYLQGNLVPLTADPNRTGWKAPHAEDEDETVRGTLKRLDGEREKWIEQTQQVEIEEFYGESGVPLLKQLSRPPRARELAFDLAPRQNVTVQPPVVYDEELGCDVEIPLEDKEISWHRGSDGERVQRERVNKGAVKRLRGVTDLRKKNAIYRRLIEGGFLHR